MANGRLTHDTAAKTFKQTTFSIVDLAGAERPEKALGTRISKNEAMIELDKWIPWRSLPLVLVLPLLSYVRNTLLQTSRRLSARLRPSSLHILQRIHSSQSHAIRNLQCQLR